MAGVVMGASVSVVGMRVWAQARGCGDVGRRWGWNGDGMEMGWRWDGVGLEMGWRWDGDGMEMGWRWERL